MIPHIHRRTFGSGARTVLAIHCSLGHSGAWRGVGAALGDIATLHAFDLPSHGRSGDWDGTGDLHDTATDMARAVLSDLGDGPVDIIGHSFGATVALRLAMEDPDRVRSASLFEPVFFAPAFVDDPAFGTHYARETAPFDAAMDAGDYVAAARTFNTMWGDTTGWDDIPAATRSYMAHRIGFVRASAPFLVGDSARLLADNRFARATSPILLLRGGASPWSAPVNAALARRLPDAQEDTVEGCGHMGPITHPDAVAFAIRNFLETR